jgi:hypothetical protein
MFTKSSPLKMHPPSPPVRVRETPSKGKRVKSEEEGSLKDDFLLFVHITPLSFITHTHKQMASLLSSVRAGLRTGLNAECRSFVTAATQPATWTRKDTTLLLQQHLQQKDKPEPMRSQALRTAMA